MKLCFWSSTFQSDSHALAEHLARQGHDVTIILPSPGDFLREAVHELVPLNARVLDRSARSTDELLRRERFDVTIVDNHLPLSLSSERLFVLWHGFGWRVDDLTTMRSELQGLVGDVTRENPRFRWQAIGDWDREYRLYHSQLADENVVALGSPFADWLRRESPLRQRFDKRSLQRAYAIDLDKPVVLLALTWHHGGSFGHWGDEELLLQRLVQHIASRGASTLVRMHDRHRYRAAYLDVIGRVAQRAGASMMLKWKNSSPDTLLDLLVSDVCISNYSSLLNAFYFTERPSIHVDPHDANRAVQVTYQMFLQVPVARPVRAPEQMWKLSPDQHGGLRAQSFDALIAQVDRALADPDCCRTQARSFLQNYVTAPDGRSCARTEKFLEAWVASGERERGTASHALARSLGDTRA
ncbi:MAG TPA: CDP-glycerol glycerophosphotransferase family protein [Polyangiales bacterium]